MYVESALKLARRLSPTGVAAKLIRLAAHREHNGPLGELAIAMIHLLATLGAIVETGRALCEWLHLF